MKSLVLLSPQPGAGVNTIAVNLGLGLTRSAKKVLLLNGCPSLSNWLSSPGHKQTSLLKRYPDCGWRTPSKENPWQDIFSDSIDYLLYVPSSRGLLAQFLAQHTAFILCVIDVNKSDMQAVLSCNQDILNLRHSPGVDLIVPNKIKPGEWSDNSQFIFELADELGWEIIADPIPHCEAIHDLPREKQSVWELPAQYSNRKASFQSLVDKILEMY